MSRIPASGTRVAWLLAHERWLWGIGGAVGILSPPAALSVMVWMLWMGPPPGLGALPVLLALSLAVIGGTAYWVRRAGGAGSARLWAVIAWCISIGPVLLAASQLSPAGEISFRVLLISAISWLLSGAALALLLQAISERLPAPTGRADAPTVAGVHGTETTGGIR